MSIEAMNRALRKAVRMIINDPEFRVIPANEPKDTRPNGSYASVALLGFDAIGWEEKTYTENGLDLTENIIGMREISFSINFFRGNARNNASKARIGLMRTSMITLLREAGMGIARRSEVRNLPFFLEDTHEERSQIDVFFSVVESDADTAGAIDEVNITGEYIKGKFIPDAPIEKTTATVNIETVVLNPDIILSNLLLQEDGRALLQENGRLLLLS